MTLLKLFRPGLGELLGLTVLSILGITVAFMVMTMVSSFESRAKLDLRIVESSLDIESANDNS